MPSTKPPRHSLRSAALVATTRVPKNAVGAILLFAGLMGWVAVGSFAKFKSAFVADLTASEPYLPGMLSYRIGNKTGFFFMCIASVKCWVVGIWVLCTPPSQWDQGSASTQPNKELTVALDGGDYHGL